MTSILSYNILLGGTGRVEELSTMIRSANPDVVGLVEATNSTVVKKLAENLGMDMYITGDGKWVRDWQLAALSRLPILHVQAHQRPGVFTRRYLLEICVEEASGTPLTIFVVHQTSDFLGGQRIMNLRRAEIAEIIQIMAAKRGTPHVLMGDFNSLAPGDSLLTSVLLRYVMREPGFVPMGKQALLEQTTGRKPTFRRRAVRSVVRGIAGFPPAAFLLDRLNPPATRGGISLLLEAGYSDSFRVLHPSERGYTFPAIVPACRIDYIFASPELAARLTDCHIKTDGGSITGAEASDHLPLYAHFS